MPNQHSSLPSSGFTHTNKDLHDCAKEVVMKARERFKSEKITAKVWSYREQGDECLSCDLHLEKDSNARISILITCAGEYDFDCWDEPYVHDMAEALHLAGLITRALHCDVIIGLGKNETNEEVLTKPLIPGETNNPINLWRN
jgi:hypothetical protein